MFTETKTQEFDLHINRYHLTKSVKNDLQIGVKRSTKATPVFGFLMFGGMSAFFGFLTVHGYLAEGYHIMMVVYTLFTLFMTTLTVALLVGSYSNKRSYHFRTNDLIITNSFGIKSTIPKSDIKSVFIQRTLITEQGKYSPHDYHIWVMLKIPSRKDGKFSLFDVEGRDSLTFMIGALDDSGMEIAEEEGLEISRIIANHWNIPLSV